jgi:hypothetical protein
MGMLLRFPRRHARASFFDPSMAKASKVIPDTPACDARRTKANQCSAGIPRTRQTLTVEGASDKADDNALVPPRESMTESDVIMDATIVCTMQTCQEFATRQPTPGTKYGAIGPMIDPRETIAWRLKGLKEAYHKDDTEEAFAAAIGLDKSTYSSIKNCRRDLSFETACYIKEKWGISLDWLFYGELQQSAVQVMGKIGQRPVAIPSRRRKHSSAAE